MLLLQKRGKLGKLLGGLACGFQAITRQEALKIHVPGILLDHTVITKRTAVDDVALDTCNVSHVQNYLACRVVTSSSVPQGIRTHNANTRLR